MGPFRGIVIDNDDPLHGCQVRAAIAELYYDAETQQCVPSPWIDSTTGAGGDQGIMNIPPVGTHIYVWQEYDDDDECYALCYTLGPGLTDHSGQGRDSTAPTVGRGEDDETCGPMKGGAPFTVPSPGTRMVFDSDGVPDYIEMEPVEIPGLPESLNAGTYANVRCIETSGGIVLELDDTPGANRIRIWHPSGSYLEISHDGTWVQRDVKKWTETAGDVTNMIGGDEAKHVRGHQRTQVTGKQVDLVNGAKMTKAGRIAFDGGTDITLTSGGPIQILSNGMATYEHGNGLEFLVGGDASYTYSGGKYESVLGEANTAINSSTTLTWTGINLTSPATLLPTNAPFVIDLHNAPLSVARMSSTGGKHLDIQGHTNALGEAFIINSSNALAPLTPGGAVAFTHLPAGLPADPLVKAPALSTILNLMLTVFASLATEATLAQSKITITNLTTALVPYVAALNTRVPPNPAVTLALRSQ